jgi:mRNA interferase RelE/StbE
VPKHDITFARSARKELEHLPQRVATRILGAIEALASEPRPDGCRKIQGAKDLWRIRVGDYRVIYGVADTHRAVDVVAIRHRRDAYR